MTRELEKITIKELNEKMRNGKAEIVGVTTSRINFKNPDFYVEGIGDSYTPRDDGQGEEMLPIKITPYIYGKYIDGGKE